MEFYNKSPSVASCTARSCRIPNAMQLQAAIRPGYLFSGECRKTGWILRSLHQRHQEKLRRLSMFRDQLNEDRIRFLNRLHREMKIYFPEYKDAFGKFDGAFSLEVLRKAPFPEDLIKLGKDGADVSRMAVKWFVERIIELDEQLLYDKAR